MYDNSSSPGEDGINGFLIFVCHFSEAPPDLALKSVVRFAEISETGKTNGTVKCIIHYVVQRFQLKREAHLNFISPCCAWLK